MNKPEYSDLYKFIVSLGLILIVFATVLPWLFLRESFDSLIKASEIANLTPTGQALITYRQNIALWFVQNIIWISLIPAVTGLILLISGLILWQRKQKLFDEKDVLETEKLRIEIQKMSPEQIAVKAIKETSVEIQDSQLKSQIKTDASTQILAINQLFRTERMIMEKLLNCFGKSNVQPYIKVSDAEIDALVRVSHTERLIFEFKSTRKKEVTRRVNVVTEDLLRAVKAYNNLATEKNTIGVGLITVIDESGKLPVEYKEFMTTKITDGIKIKIFVFTESEFVSFECNELRSMFSAP